MHVVLVDPSRTATKFISRLLEARQHAVCCFADGREALAYIKSEPSVDALITSAEPLSMTGLELCWETRLITTCQRPIYVIMMSSIQDHDMVIHALDHGADDFLSKVPVPEELFARLRSAERFVTMQRELIRLATTDSLTGMFNRRAFFEKAKELCAEATTGKSLCAVMIDIDHFKRVNDTYGHDAGDIALCAVAKELAIERGLLGRLGGEEFALLLQGRSMADGVAAADRLRENISALKIDANGERLSVTASFGVSEWHSGDTIDARRDKADRGT